MKTLLIIAAILFSAPKSTDTTPLDVPMNGAPLHEYSVHATGTKNVEYQSYSVSPLRTNTKSVNVYGGSSSVLGSVSTKSQEQRMSSFSAGSTFAAPQSKICQYCNGTGYINDYGNGELVNAKWYFQTDDIYGDGTSCTDKTGYHDSCDVASQGQIYHHFAKRKCPYCNGTGRDGRSKSGWTSWTGLAWSHAFSDDDHNGHCDEHYWHAPIGDGVAIMIVLALMYCLFLLTKYDAKLDKYFSQKQSWK